MPTSTTPTVTGTCCEKLRKHLKKQIISAISSHLNCMEKKLSLKKKMVNFTPHDENGYTKQANLIALCLSENICKN